MHKLRIRTTHNLRRFTLVEILVSMAVFSILLAMLLQFFSGAQKLWAESERKSSIYSNARIAMNLMASTLQSIYYVEQESPFLISQNEYVPSENLRDDNILFLTKYPLSLKDGNESLYYLQFQLDHEDAKTDSNEMQGKLSLRYLGPNIPGKQNEYRNSFNGWSNYSSYIGTLRGYLEPPQEIISGVTSFAIRPWYPDYGNGLSPVNFPTSLPERVPSAVELKLSLLSPENYLTWYTLNGNKSSSETPAGKEFRLANEQTFSRIVNLGDFRRK